VVELLMNGRLADHIRRDLSERSDSLIVPHLLDIEVASALWRLISTRAIDTRRAAKLFDGLLSLLVERYAHTPLLGRIWELRHKFTCYDAVYIALAEATDSILFTCDGKLTDGHRARVRAFKN